MRRKSVRRPHSPYLGSQHSGVDSDEHAWKAVAAQSVEPQLQPFVRGDPCLYLQFDSHPQPLLAKQRLLQQIPRERYLLD
ncbi:hypothetical protein LINPERPRIM_LOCUS38432 [Linum perenne]